MTQVSHRLPHHHHIWASPISRAPNQSGTFLTVDEPTLTYCNRSKSTVHLMVHSWCCAFCRFHKYINTYIHHYSIMQNISTALKIPLFSAAPSLTCSQPWANTDLFIVCAVFIAFAVRLGSWDHMLYSHFRLACFIQ